MVSYLFHTKMDIIISNIIEKRSFQHNMGSLRESLLDRFPFRSHELDRLLQIFDASRSRLRDDCSNLLLSSCLFKEDHTDAIVFVEKEILPELSQIFQDEYLDAVVVGISDKDQPEFYEKAKFLEACKTLLGRSSERDLVARLCNTLKKESSPLRIADFVLRLAKAAFLLHFRSLPSREINLDRLLATVAQSVSSLMTGDREIKLSQKQIDAWLEGQAKHAPKLLSTVFHFALLGDTLSGTTFQNDSFSNPRYKSSLFSWVTGCERQIHVLHPLSGFWEYTFDPVPFHLSLMGLGGPWFEKNRRLYNSDEDGLAFSSFTQALVSFMGPTLVLIRTTENEVLGFYTELPWKKGPKWYTASDESSSHPRQYPVSRSSSLLFRIQPSWTCYNLIPRGNNMSDCESLSHKPYTSGKCYHQFLSTPVSYRRGQGTMEGLAIGGIAADAPRLHLNPTLEGCHAGYMDTTFEPGSLLKDERDIETLFDVDALEVWAIRSESFGEDLAAGKLNASVRESTRLQMAQVDRRQFVEDFAAGMILSDLYRHRDQSWGRADFNVDETK